MTDDIQRKFLSALLVAMRPVAKMLLRNGIGHREFNEITKLAFVDVATSDYGLRGRPTNISRVAVMTGLTRKEVRRIRDKISRGDEAVVAKSTPLGEVLHRWFSDVEFLDEVGKPKAVPFEGSGATFSELVKRSGGDIPPGAMRTELKRTGAIIESDGGLLFPLKRIAMPEETHEKLITGLVRGLFPLATTIAHNTDPAERVDPWLQRTVSTRFVRRQDIPRLKRVSHDRLEAFTETMDDLYSAYETIHSSEEGHLSEDERVVGIGVFYFED